jgi:hypothetical protein
MTGTLWAAIAVLAMVTLAFTAVWLADARRANRVATDPERVSQRRPWLLSRRAQATHRGRRHA